MKGRNDQKKKKKAHKSPFGGPAVFLTGFTWKAFLQLELLWFMVTWSDP